MKNSSNILWGIVLVVLGAILSLNAFDITNINIFFDGWWTLFIIVPSIIGLFDNNNEKTGNIIGIVVGVLLLLACREIIDFRVVWKLFLPIILVIIGLSLIFKNTITNSINNKIKKINKNNKDNKEYISTFSGQKIDFSNEEFKGCSLSAVFGGLDLDLRDAVIKEDVVINATSVFGGIEIRMPKNVNVKVNSTSIFGGVDNKSKSDNNSKVTIYVNATCLFGGVTLK